MEPTVFLAFLYGFGGSLAVEIVLFLHAMGPRGGIPGKYKTPLFWTVRVLLALISGGFAAAYFAPNLPLFIYVHLGAATPAILTRASRVVDEASPADAS